MPTVRANEITINYDQQGTGEPLILIPYLAPDYACYAFQVAEYAKHFTCISVDLRAVGLQTRVQRCIVQFCQRKTGTAARRIHETIRGGDRPRRGVSTREDRGTNADYFWSVRYGHVNPFCRPVEAEHSAC